MAKTISAELRESLLDLEDGMADRIREASEASGISNRQIAHSMDVAERTVQDWKNNGQVARKNIPLLAHVLNCSISWLMTGEEDSFQTSTDDNTVVEFTRPITEGPIGKSIELFTRHVPVIEVSQITEVLSRKTLKQGTHYLESLVQEIITDPKRGSIVITHTGNTPGIPTYAFQCLVEFFDPHIRQGELMGMATDILPAPGEFTAFGIRKDPKKDPVYMAGWYSPVANRINPTNISDQWENVDEFVLAVNRDFSPHPMDIYVKKESNPIYLGVMTYSSYWHSQASRNTHTGLSSRVRDNSYASLINTEDESH